MANSSIAKIARAEMPSHNTSFSNHRTPSIVSLTKRANKLLFMLRTPTGLTAFLVRLNKYKRLTRQSFDQAPIRSFTCRGVKDVLFVDFAAWLIKIITLAPAARTVQTHLRQIAASGQI